MKLYVYEHCPFCVRARMIFGLKGFPVDRAVVMEGDSQTPIQLVGRKVLPIFEKSDGSHMAESMDIVHYVDALDEAPLLVGAADPAIKTWYDRAWPIALKLFIPRFTKAQFAELATPEARVAYEARETKAFGDLDALMQDTPALAGQMNALLADLEPIIANRLGINVDDFLLYPLLRSLSIVRPLDFGSETSAYMRTMAQRSGVPLLFDQAR